MKVQQQQRGFTIIEVVLVLAIAGLIFLMVFIALPALQAGQRDTQRKSDISRINTQISNYTSSNRGKIPTETQFVQSSSGFVTRYLGAKSAADGGAPDKAGDDYVDPSTGEGYVFQTGAVEPDAEGEVVYRTGHICGDDGATTSTGANARNYTLRMKLEGQTSPYCIDNR